ncbi:DNRLRE domain-containing protein [Reichenbachiella carrageenanivorans]|uniref:DNRLRE domain-containing protein n=2 Tax=Reichenbachiella carrageenanivorans TaxID=2979869 RepID=A0ABY6D5E6_9BACT|nr:DNRLRE domain-containing protein [Reichenbachiella carrageenanivorans]UXX81389.1 DNRLRE domain-containing protein [Reichenbachiella carrageenanivorans]
MNWICKSYRYVQSVLVIVCCLVFISLEGNAQTTITISGTSAIDDTYLRSTKPTSNYGSSLVFKAATWTAEGGSDYFRSLMRIDCSAVPEGSVITNATITFRTDPSWTYVYAHNSSYTSSNEVYLEKITSAWGETSVTWNNQPSTTTSGRVFVPESTSQYETRVINITGLVQDFVNNPTTNFGFMMKMVNETTYCARNYGSSEHTSYAPVVSITYSDPILEAAFPYAENFESTPATWWNPASNQVEWVSGATGPMVAPEGSKYCYMEAPDGNQTGELISPEYNLSLYSSPKLKFSYHMYGADIGSLELVLTNEEGEPFSMWSIEGDQGNSWKSVEVDLDVNFLGHGIVTLSFIGTAGSGDMSYIAIDAIEVISSPQESYSYTFENHEYWHNVGGQSISWQDRSGSTPSENTGPSSAYEGSRYVYLEASSPNYPSKVGIYESPVLNLSNISHPFFIFHYHMYGANMGTLKVDVSTNYGNSWTTIWSISGDQGDAWHEKYLDLTSYKNTTVLIRYHGTTGDGYAGDIAIDDVSITTQEVVAIFDENFEQALIDLGYDNVHDGLVYKHVVKELTTLDVSNKNIANMEGIQEFTSLTSLNASFNQLAALDLTANTLLEDLNLAGNQLATLDLSNNISLTTIDVDDNQFTEIDLSGLTSLLSFSCSHNQLQELNLASNSFLTGLDCSDNQLIKLDISMLPNLTSLNATGHDLLLCLTIYEDQELNIENAVGSIDPASEYNTVCPVYSLADGNWEDASIWPDGVAPGVNDKVRIVGNTVTISNTVYCQSLKVEQGITGKKGQLLISDGGYLELRDYLKVVEGDFPGSEKSKVVLQGGHLKVLGDE